jgi:hypothetical protein
MVKTWFDYAAVYDEAFYYVRKLNAPCVEIGAWKGDSTLYMANMFKTAARTNSVPEFYTIDTWQGSDEPAHKLAVAKAGGDMFPEFWKRMQKQGVADYVYPIQRRSEDAAAMFLRNSLSFVFVDGGHSFEQVYRDITLYYPAVKWGGAIAGHDYDWAEVRLAVSRVAYEASLTVQTKGRCWWINK